MKGKWISVVLALALAVVAFGALPAPQALAACANNASTQFHSVGTGNWNATATWECSDDGSTWQAATVTPTSSHGAITVRNGHTVTNTANGVIVDQLTIDSGGQVTINSTVTWTLADGTAVPDLIVNGTLLNSGGTWTTSGTWSVGSGGTYVHNTTSGVSTPLGKATLNAASNFIYRGSSTLVPAVSISGRTYGNLVFESTSGALSIASNSGASSFTVNGTMSVGTTGGGTVTYNTTGFTGAIAVVGSLGVGSSSTLIFGASTVALSGDVTNNGTFNNSNASNTVTFKAVGTQTLGGSAGTTFNNLTVNSGTTLVESTDATVNGTLTNNGTIRNSNTVSGNGAQSFGLTGVTMNVTAGTGAITVDRIDKDHPNATTDGGTKGTKTGKYWTITGTGFTVDLTLPHAGLAAPNVCKYPGGLGGAGWDCQVSASTGTTATRNGVTSFSDWAVGSSVGPTAVTLRALTARAPRSPGAAALPALGLVAAAGAGVARTRRPRS